MSNFVTVSLVEAKFFYADRRRDGRTDGQTEMIKLRVAFRNFFKSPNKML
jgi:hypothetical protein